MCVSALILILILILQMLPLPPLALLPLQPASARTAGLASLSIAWPVPPAALVASQLSKQQQLLLLHQYQLCQAHPLLLPYLTTSRQRAATPAENRPLLLLAVHLASELPADQVRRQQLSVCV